MTYLARHLADRDVQLTGGVRTARTLPIAAGLALGALATSLGVAADSTHTTIGPGPIGRWMLPTTTTLHHLALILTTGCLVVAGFVLPPGARSARLLVLTTSTAASVIWLCSAVTVLVLTALNLVGRVDVASFPRDLWTVAATVGAGRSWLAIAMIALAVVALTAVTRKPGALGAAAGLALTAAIPLSLTGHAAADDRAAAPVAMALHWAGVMVWVGGVAALALVAPALTRSRPPGAMGGPAPGIQRAVLERFSAIAGVAFVVVLGSGVLSSVLRLGGWDTVTSPYGLLILVKAAATAALGAIGLAHRRWTIARVGRGPAGRAAWRLIGAEVLIMAGVIGIAVALGRTPPP